MAFADPDGAEKKTGDGLPDGAEEQGGEGASDGGEDKTEEKTPAVLDLLLRILQGTLSRIKLLLRGIQLGFHHPYYITMIINGVLQSMIWGAALAIIVLALFLKDVKPSG